MNFFLTSALALNLIASSLLCAEETSTQTPVTSGQEEVIQFTGDSSFKNSEVVKKKSAFKKAGSGLSQIIFESPDLEVPLQEVVILVILVNVFALFRRARLILMASYLFCLKWVCWSNYQNLLKHSDSMAITSSAIFAIFGVLTLILFLSDRFNHAE